MKIEKVILPLNVFSGTYENIWACAIDNELEYFCEEHDCTTDDIDYTVNWKNIFDNIGKSYETVLPSNFAEYGIINMAYVGNSSPQYYNFSTDHIYMDMEISIYRVLRTIAANKAEFCEILENNHKSRSGFISFYAYDLDTIREKKELFTDVYMSDFLELCERLHAGGEYPDFCHTSESEVYDNVTCNGRIEIAIELCESEEV